MLRFLYLLSLLLYIELSFCYNYIDDTTERNLNKLGRNVRREKFKRAKRLKERKSLTRQEYDYDKNPVEFDVASFIQPDEETLNEGEDIGLRNTKRGRSSKMFDYGNLMDINVDDINKKKDKSTDYLNIGVSNPDLTVMPPLVKDVVNTKHLNYNSLDDLHNENFGPDKYWNIYRDDLIMDQTGHNQEKKCTFKSIKFPFFSHNKSEPLKSKKNKRRKIFCFRCSKKDDHRLNVPDETEMNDDPVIHFKVKRSYIEKLCPACKKIYLYDYEENEKRKKTPRRVIHNSRQFYQPNYLDVKLKDGKNMRKRHLVYSEQDLDANYRKQRNASDKERQLKELDEVEKKIDNVEINLNALRQKGRNT